MIDKSKSEKAVNVIRGLAVDMINKANSGHPGLPLGAAPMAYSLYARHMRYDSKDPNWFARDRFVLSAGHGSALLYSILHTFGYDLPMDELKQFRQWGSITPGHPEYGMTPGVETTTGPLGQGFANAVGMEMAREYMAGLFDKDDIKLFDNHTFTLLGDGCMMEGVVAEAASLAGHLKLKNLIALYDDNNITIEGETKITYSDEVSKRFEAYGFEVFNVKDGNDLKEIDEAIEKAKRSERPSLIIVKTVIGYGSQNMSGTSKVHGSPLGEAEAKLTKENLGIEPDKTFYIPEDIKKHFEDISNEKNKQRKEWEKKFDTYKVNYPEQAKILDELLNGYMSKLIKPEDIAQYKEGAIATRAVGGEVLNKLAEVCPAFIGGSADLAPSTKTYLNQFEAMCPTDKKGRNIHFGIREHAMGAIVNGITVYANKHLRAYCSTFLVFSDYVRHSLRLAALMDIPSVFIFTHDSIGVGEDGPTHQPVEHIMSLRLIPNLYVIRPADANETAWLLSDAFRAVRPSCFALSRQKLPVLSRVNKDCLKGGYILSKREGATHQIIATGSEVHIAIEAAEELESKGIKANVISMPCVKLFEDQDIEYKEKVVSKEKKTYVVEAGVSRGWERYAPFENIIGIDRFGESAPEKRVMNEFGFSKENIVKRILG
ncbi:MAG: transketolase [Candidatus Muiribacterium halophilum]|uniref:Transketolase n=1 Tax=Muiribacterium halophilum TaxID=2053465 RepID=A0A2N5ZK10_MUIH1|nr:MAG: transketolase [Candidatus Muirbacterium halophilum]